MNKYLSLLVVCALAFSGCSKDKSKKTTVKKNGTKTEAVKSASNDDIALFGDKGQEQASAAETQKDIDNLLQLWSDELPKENVAFNFQPVHFPLNRAKVIDGEEVKLQENIEQALAAADQGKAIVVKGHCCQTGSQSFNLALSQKRANNVKNKLVAAGIPEANIQAVGLGSECPLVWTDKTDRESLIKELAPNRRVEIEVAA